MTLRTLVPALLALAACACQGPQPDPPGGDDLGPVADFTLTERGGAKVGRADLEGEVWVAAFQFTRCTQGCPQVSATLRRLQDELAHLRDFRLVTFTVDPEHDDPAALREYARRFGADPERWLFLTGPEAEVHALVRHGFRLAVAKREGADPGQAVDHAFKLVVVDRAGRVRGYYDGLPDSRWPGAEATFETDLRRLKRQVGVLLTPEAPAYMPRDFPRFNATLNAACVALLLLGYAAVRQRLIRLHAACMLTAVGVSALFLASYLYFHLVIKGGRATRFEDQAIGAPDWVRTAYFVVLGTHTVLAVFVVPLALFTAYQGLTGRIRRHVRVARWTLPIWLYVSVTGVAVYWMLYRLYP